MSEAGVPLSSVGPLRVAFLVYRGNPLSGGQGVYTKYLTRELVDLGHHVEVFSGPPYPELDARVVLHRIPSLDLFREPDPFRIPKFREFRSRYDLFEFLLMCTGAFPEPRTYGMRLRRALRERLNTFDVIHDNQSLSHTMLWLQRKGIPVVASIHHPITVDRRLGLAAATTLKERLGILRFYGFIRMQTHVARRLSRIITVSRASAEDIEAEMGVPGERISVASVGVDPSMFRPLPSMEREPGLLVTTASADVPLKGLRFLIDALSALVQEGRTELRLVVIGREREGSPVQRLVSRLGLSDRVTFLGALTQDEMIEWYARGSLMIVPSLYEGFSLPCIEAMACGIPLLTTTGGAIPEVVGADGECAILVEAGDAAALAGGISAALDDWDGALRRANRGILRAHSLYSWRSSALAVEAVYHEMLDTHAVGAEPSPDAVAKFSDAPEQEAI